MTGFMNFVRRPTILYEFSRILDVYEDFSIDEFMEGAEEAFCSLNQALTTGDKDFLEQVCEPQIRKAILGRSAIRES